MNERGLNNTRKFERFGGDEGEGLGLSCKLCQVDCVTLKDLSIGGAGVCLNEPVEVGATCELGIKTPGGQFSLRGSVIWVREEQDKNCRYMAGVRFEKDSIESSKDLVFKLLNEE